MMNLQVQRHPAHQQVPAPQVLHQLVRQQQPVHRHQRQAQPARQQAQVQQQLADKYDCYKTR